MTEREILEGYQPGDKDYEKAQYALIENLSLIDFDEWVFIGEVLKRDIPFEAVQLMNEYVDKYNDCYGTDYDWDWMSYPENEETRQLFEDMILFAQEKEGERP